MANIRSGLFYDFNLGHAYRAIPIIADESLYSLQDAMALVKAGAVDVFSIYIGKCGGIGPARKVAAVAGAAGLTCIEVCYLI